jgi:hypothetical protein
LTITTPSSVMYWNLPRMFKILCASTGAIPLIVPSMLYPPAVQGESPLVVSYWSALRSLRVRLQGCGGALDAVSCAVFWV